MSPITEADAEDFRFDELKGAIADILESLGYDLNDQHFLRTPERAAEVLWSLRRNGNPDFVKSLLEVVFTEDSVIDSLVLEGPISFDSMCAHHMLPVNGVAYVGYLPDKHVCGLSKLARVTHHFAKQYTVQERVTQQIADALVAYLEPRGAMVVVTAKHGCMTMRGVRERETDTTTSAVRGVFKDSASARNEFLQLMTLRSAK